jgi:hypothetical protein
MVHFYKPVFRESEPVFRESEPVFRESEQPYQPRFTQLANLNVHPE